MRAERVKELKDTKDKAEAKSKKQIEENNKKIQALQKRVCYIHLFRLPCIFVLPVIEHCYHYVLFIIFSCLGLNRVSMSSGLTLHLQKRL